MKKNGFTLVELLAIIIILGILAVIMIPKVTDAIENSRISSAKASAYGYKKAVEEYYLNKKMNKESIFLEGTYKINEEGNLYNTKDTHTIKINGSKPINGQLVYIKNELDSGCITIDKYKIIFEKGEVTGAEEGNCSQIIYEMAVYLDPTDLNKKCSKDNYNKDSEAKEGCMKWYVLDEDDTTYTMILDHNTTDKIKWVDSEDYKDESLLDRLGLTSSSSAAYPSHTSDESNLKGPITLLKQLKDDTSKWTVLETPTNYKTTWENNKQTYTYSINYEDYNARLLTIEEVEKLTGIDIESSSGWDKIPSTMKWLYNGPSNSGYWLSSSYSKTFVDAWDIDGHGYLDITYTTNNYYGIRPVIKVSKEKLK